jgi:hypothetical protein
VHTATGKVESLPGGLTKNPVPIVLNRGEPLEVTLYERLAFTDSKGNDLLIGTRAAYPCGLSVDRWAERAVYQADWRGKGEVIGHLPMKLHQERQGGWTTVSSKRQRRQGQAAVALAPGWGGADGPSVPVANSAEQVVVRAQDVVAVRRAQRSYKSRWPRGPRVDMAQEAA